MASCSRHPSQRCLASSGDKGMCAAENNSALWKMGARGHLMENRSELTGSSGHSSAHIFREKHPLHRLDAAAWWSRSPQTFQNLFFTLIVSFLLKFQETGALCPTVNNLLNKAGNSRDRGPFWMEAIGKTEVFLFGHHNTPGFARAWCLHGGSHVRSVWRRNTHPAGICILHILWQNGEYTLDCIFPSALVLHSELHATCLQGKQQPFTLTFTPMDNSVHLIGASLDRKQMQRQAEHKLHTATIWELNFWPSSSANHRATCCKHNTGHDVVMATISPRIMAQSAILQTWPRFETFKASISKARSSWPCERKAVLSGPHLAENLLLIHRIILINERQQWLTIKLLLTRELSDELIKKKCFLV